MLPAKARRVVIIVDRKETRSVRSKSEGKYMYPTFPRSSGSADAKLPTSSFDQLMTFFQGREKTPRMSDKVRSRGSD